MIKRLILAAALALSLPLSGESATDADLTIQVVPPTSAPSIPSAASSVGFTTLALNSDFTQPQPSGWFGCIGSGSGHTWYAANEGSDSGTPVPCPTRYNLVTDSTTGKQAFDLTFLPSDVGSSRHYTSIQTVDDSGSCCVHGVTFPTNGYWEATFRVRNTPAVPKMYIGGTWWGFWQAGEGTPPGSRTPTEEIDHSENHGEWPEMMSWAVLNWYRGLASGGGYFPYLDVATGLDSTAYHTYGVRTRTTATQIEACSYIDNAQRGCNTFPIDPGQSTERKFPILFVGIHCYYFPSLSANCVNKPIASTYSCDGGKFCVHFATKVEEQNFWPVQMNISGVTGASNINGSWQASPISWSNGATDWILNGTSFNGSPTGGTANATSQVDMLIQSVRIWSCASWQTTYCGP